MRRVQLAALCKHKKRGLDLVNRNGGKARKGSPPFLTSILPFLIRLFSLSRKTITEADMDTHSGQLDSPMHCSDQVNDSSGERKSSSSVSQDPAKKRDKKKNKRQSKEVTRERKRAKANVTTGEEDISKEEPTKEITSAATQNTEIDSIGATKSQADQAHTTSVHAPIIAISSSTLPKVLPRIPVSSSLLPRGLVPRQVTRPQTSAKRKPGIHRTIAAMTSLSVSKDTSTSAMPAPKVAISAAESTKAKAAAGQPIFRAKDIRAKAAAVDAAVAATVEKMSTLTSISSSRQQPSRPHHSHSNTYSDTRQSHSSSQHPPRHPHQNDQNQTTQGDWRSMQQPLTKSSTPTNGSSKEHVAMTGTGLIRAKPIMVTMDGKFEFPYGNYPSYYEKRSREQKQKSSTEPTLDSSSSGIPKRILASPCIVMGTNKDVDDGSVGQHQRQIQHFRAATPSVLFPAPRTTVPSITGNKDTDPKEEDVKFSVQALAKSVDLRLEFLQGNWFRGKRVLDIGCNSGLLTVFIAMHYRPSKIEGVDVDPSLIGKAQNFVLKTFSQISRQAYLQEPGSSSEEGGSSHNNNQNNDDPIVPYQSYFPRALQRMHGSLPIPAKTEKTQSLFPHNIELRITDWVSEGEDSSKDVGNKEGEGAASSSSSLSPATQQYDVILGFSITKWIHLQHGDDGLKKFFKKVYRSLAPEGIFLMEPQAHSTYKKRSKITKVKKKKKSLLLRPRMLPMFFNWITHPRYSSLF